MSKRMFSADIVESDAFLDMPLTAQALYMHLNMNADNDGFVNPKRILRMVGANDDDLRILIAKRFVLVFPSGVVVIKHWWINNTKRLDRHVPTNYQHELAELDTKPNKSYTEKWSQTRGASEISEIDGVVENKRLTSTEYDKMTNISQGSATKWQPNGNQMAPEAMFNRSYVHVHDQVHVQSNITTSTKSSAQERRDDVSKKSPQKRSDPGIDEMFDVWAEVVGYELKSAKAKNRTACKNLLNAYGKDKLTQLIHGVALALDDRFAPRISDFRSLHDKANDLIVWGRKKNNPTSGVYSV